MHRVLVITGVLMFFSACGPEAPEKVKVADTLDISAAIFYFRDDRPTEPICFAAIRSVTYWQYQITSITTVPCEQVVHLLGH